MPVDRIQRLAQRFQDNPLSVSLDAYSTLFARGKELPEVLEKCDSLNKLSASIPAAAIARISSVPAGLDDLDDIVCKTGGMPGKG